MTKREARRKAADGRRFRDELAFGKNGLTDWFKIFKVIDYMGRKIGRRHTAGLLRDFARFVKTLDTSGQWPRVHPSDPK